MQLGRSVLGTTVEACRLVLLGLLAVPGQPPPAGGPAGAPASAAMSFLRAVPGERGSSDA
jgi:hypothetical protein